MASYYESMSRERSDEILAVCAGLPIQRVWRSVDCCIFLEIGELFCHGQDEKPYGQIQFMVESDWRVEKLRSIQFGSGFSERQIEKHIDSLLNAVIKCVETTEMVPELRVSLTDGRRFTTFTNWSNQPRWSIGFKDTSMLPLDPLWRGIDVAPWMHIRAGRVCLEYCYDDSSTVTRKTVRQIQKRSK